MQVKKKLVHDNIVENAKKEFLANGYEHASMRKIAKDSQITVGNIYRYFDNKEALFKYIVEPAYELVIALVETIETAADRNSNISVFEDPSVLTEKVDKFIDIAREYRSELIILLEGANGSRFEGSKRQITLFLENRMKAAIDHLTEVNKYKVGESYIAHVIVHAFMEGLIEIIKFDDFEKMEEMSHQFVNLIFRDYIKRIVTE
ncbi:MAG: TetR/AcrR family transcriptional regulator [Tissierellales bacterium]|jgi:AcrR family transcriptional regulator|nr:TetR/AcrR family transcriptional regulator [Tissierellales bacterium]